MIHNTGRIVFICPGLTEPGGTARRSRLFAEGLAAAGWDVRVITRSGVLKRPRLERGERLLVIELPGFGLMRIGAGLFYLLATPLALLMGLRARAFLSLQLLSTSTVAGICARVLGKRFVAMASTGGELSETRYIQASKTAAARKRLIRGATWVVAQTPSVALQLEAIADPERIVVLPNPVDAPEAPPGLTGAPRFLYAGRLSAEKDLDSLLDAWLQLGDLPEAALTLLGEGGAFRSVEAELRARVTGNPRLADSVEMPGWVPDVTGYLRQNDFFVLPSLEEGMSNALLEACAWGRIPIVSAIEPNLAVVGAGYPFTFEPGDTEDLARNLERAMAEESAVLEDVRRCLRERIDQRFSNRVVIEALQGLLR